MSNPLESEFQWYRDNQDSLVAQYNGKVLVIMGHKVIGVFDSELQALQETSKSHKPGTFLIQRCEPGNEKYTMAYHSRVAVC